MLLPGYCFNNNYYVPICCLDPAKTLPEQFSVMSNDIHILVAVAYVIQCLVESTIHLVIVLTVTGTLQLKIIMIHRSLQEVQRHRYTRHFAPNNDSEYKCLKSDVLSNVIMNAVIVICVECSKCQESRMISCNDAWRDTC